MTSRVRDLVKKSPEKFDIEPFPVTEGWQVGDTPRAAR
jgi:hypothetical protein